MNNNAKLWVELLPTFKQAKEYLKTEEGYCCLGVACAISKVAQERISDCNSISFDDECFMLPESVRKWLGLATNEGTFEMNAEIAELIRPYFGGDFFILRGKCNLTFLNDGGVPFSVIAKIIQLEPRGLFVA